MVASAQVEAGLAAVEQRRLCSKPDFDRTTADYRENIETHSPHVNVLAVFYDPAPPEQQPEILARFFAPEI